MHIFNIKIPTLPALIVISLVISSFFYFTEGSFFKFGGKAENKQFVPENIIISNRTEDGFTVSWKTIQPSTGYITYNNSSRQTIIAYDTRDSDSVPKSYMLHYVTILIPDPETKTLSYTIVSNTEQYPQKAVELFPEGKTAPNIQPIYGMITADTEQLAQGYILYASSENSSVLSRFIIDNPMWIIPFAQLKTINVTDYYCNEVSCTDDTRIQLEIQSSEKTIKTTTALGEARPYQTILDLNNVQSELDDIPAPVADVSPTAVMSPTPINPSKIPNPTKITPAVFGANSKKTDYDLTILSPKNNSSLTFPKPLIRGLGVSGSTISISLKGEVVQVGETTVGKDGIWMWTPLYNLNPGTHSVQVKSIHKNGTPATQTSVFTILPSGLNVLSASTPSATLSPLTPTSYVSLTPYASPSIPLSYSTPSPTLPNGGTYTPTILISTAGLFLISIAVALTLL